MAKIIINAGLVSELISKSLRKTGDFTVISLPNASREELETVCRRERPDMLLLNVGPCPAQITMSERRSQIETLHRDHPKYKIALLLDMNIGETQLGIPVTLKQAGLIQSFFYNDCSLRYVTASLQSIAI